MNLCNNGAREKKPQQQISKDMIMCKYNENIDYLLFKSSNKQNRASNVELLSPDLYVMYKYIFPKH